MSGSPRSNKTNENNNDFNEFKKELFMLLDKYNTNIEFDTGIFGSIAKLEISGQFGKLKATSRKRTTNIRKFLKEVK